MIANKKTIVKRFATKIHNYSKKMTFFAASGLISHYFRLDLNFYTAGT